MFELTKNHGGNIGIAIVVVVISLLSGISLSSIAFKDSHTFRMQLDAIQEFHFLRSEVGRGRFIATHFESIDNPPLQAVLPTRLTKVQFGTHQTVYRSRTKLEIYEVADDAGYYIRSLITAVRGKEDSANEELQSPVRKYSENRIRSLLTLAIFHYFSDIDEERDGSPGNIRFYGGDIVYGRVHSNSDIWIMGTPWPTFHGLVTTGGEIRVYSGGQYSREEVFRGGLIEHYRKVVFEPSAQLVRRLGTTPLGGTTEDEKIAYVTVEGTNFDILLGEIVEENKPGDDGWVEGVNQFTIYNSYPPYGPVGDSVGVNRIPRKDTLWRHAQSGSLRNTSAFIPMQMWISGVFGGKQTWASSHDIYLKGDLLYEGTTPGHRPDGIDDSGNPTRPVNRSDYLGIISEESIWIQYGHWSPEDSTRHKPNTESIYMYGAYCAVGQGENTWDDGIFSFQYQFPKGSTPPQYWFGERFNKIDLHLFHYPTTVANPWPLGLDYPWYNPLWPEPGRIFPSGFPATFPFPDDGRTPNPHRASWCNVPDGLRGNIWLYGSVAQRRRGYVRRSGNTDFDTGLWDIDNVISPNTPPQYGAPPPGIGPSGYDKRYYFDTRFERVGPPHFPLVKFEGYESEELMDLGHLTVSWVFRKPPSNF